MIPELVTRAQYEADTGPFDPFTGEPRETGARPRWKYFDCRACKRWFRVSMQRGAFNQCGRPDCALEAVRYPIRVLIEVATATGDHELAAKLADALDHEALKSGEGVFLPDPDYVPIATRAATLRAEHELRRTERELTEAEASLARARQYALGDTAGRASFAAATDRLRAARERFDAARAMA